MTDDIKTKTLISKQRREQGSRGTTLIPINDGHSLDD